MKDIPGFEGLYKVDEDGNVFSLRGKNIRKLKPSLSEGYPGVQLYKPGSKPIYRKIHRLMCIAFFGEGLEINHKNGIRTDNNLLNLEVCNRSQNIKHSYDVLKRKRVSGVLNGKSKLILDTVTGIYYDCIAEAAEAKCIRRNILKSGLNYYKGSYKGLIYA